jgi:hypothetical protein
LRNSFAIGFTSDAQRAVRSVQACGVRQAIGCFLRSPQQARVRIDGHDPVRPFSIKTRIGDPPLSGKLCNLRAIRRIHKKCGYTDDFCRIKYVARSSARHCSVYLHIF